MGGGLSAPGSALCFDTRKSRRTGWNATATIRFEVSLLITRQSCRGVPPWAPLLRYQKRPLHASRGAPTEDAPTCAPILNSPSVCSALHRSIFPVIRASYRYDRCCNCPLRAALSHSISRSDRLACDTLSTIDSVPSAMGSPLRFFGRMSRSWSSCRKPFMLRNRLGDRVPSRTFNS